MAAIFLIGARAAGKTTVGRTLAHLLNLPFVDTDQRLLENAGRTVAEIVAAEGWPAFRALESATLRESTLLHPGGAVVSTGGGVVLATENRRHMRAHGTVFYLAAPAQALAARLARDPLAAQRPSLTGQDISLEISQVLAERQTFYEEAAHHILDATLPPEAVCAAVLRALKHDAPLDPNPVRR